VAVLACTREPIPGAGDEDVFNVRLGLNLPAVDETKSVVSGTENAVSTIQLLCFNELGYYLGSYNATVTNTSSDPDHGKLTATIPSETRRIHFIANKTVSLSGSYIGWKETRLMSDALFTTSYNDSNPQVVFWGYYRNDDAAAMKTYLEAGNNTVYLLRDRAKVVISDITTAQSGTDVSTIHWTISNGLQTGYIVPIDNSKVSTDPYTGYYTSETVEGVTTYYGNTIVTPYTDNGRYISSEDNLEPHTTPQYLYEDENSTDNPVKLILKVTYTDKSVRYHTVLLMDDTYQQYVVTRSHTYNLKINGLPKSMGYASFAEAAAGTHYSNNQLVEVSKVVTDVTNGNYILNITETTGTSVIYQTPAAGGAKSIGFKFTDLAGNPVSDYAFRATWVEHDGSIASNETTVTYDTSTGVGSIGITLNAISTSLQQGVLLLQDTKYGLARYIHIYTIDKFRLVSGPTLSAAGNSHNGYPVYKLDFTLPSDYPSGLYPVNVYFATSTLNAYSDNSADASSGSFGVIVKKTSSLTNSTTATDWNYNASSWGYWYHYAITERSSNDAYTFYLEDVRSKRAEGNRASDVGLFFRIDYFGDPIAVSPD